MRTSVVLLALCLAACGGTSTVVANDGGPSDSSPPPSDGGCLGPEPAQPGDPCCAGYVWVCDTTTHMWTKEGLGCACIVDSGLPPPPDGGLEAGPPRDGGPIDAGTFACGPMTCSTSSYCAVRNPGVDSGAGPHYECDPLPVQCVTWPPSCACVQPAVMSTCPTNTSSMCTDTTGGVVIECLTG